MAQGHVIHIQKLCENDLLGLQNTLAIVYRPIILVIGGGADEWALE